MNKPVPLAGYRQIAAWFGVQPGTARKWRERYADFPTPDFNVDELHPGWHLERQAEIRAWHASRVGPGVGGGRPRKNG